MARGGVKFLLEDHFSFPEFRTISNDKKKATLISTFKKRIGGKMNKHPVWSMSTAQVLAVTLTP